LRRSLIAPVIAGSLILTLAPSAAGRVPHTVGPGETLWSIAAASNLTTRTLAAANGLPETANVVLGSTVWIPSEAEGTRALAAGGVASASAPAPEPLGGYTVRAGDTLSGIAARSGISVSELAWMNGLDPDQALLAGTPLKLPTGASPAPTATAPPNPTAVPNAAPHPTPEFVSPGQVGQVASANGVSPSLAAAVARQESGFNNNLVSGANARGVMQILPGTWDFVQRNLASSPMNPASAQDNVHAGVMYLGQLVRDTGGDEAAATAAYYQGLGSVRRIGLLPETRRYVANVMALRRVYGGP
jgi:soluble lytic murein transglycosylase-like protein